jgi:hypothetical protein
MTPKYNICNYFYCAQNLKIKKLKIKRPCDVAPLLMSRVCLLMVCAWCWCVQLSLLRVCVWTALLMESVVRSFLLVSAT